MGLEVKGVRFCYVGRDEFVLKGIDLKVRPGEFILISGPTGCGKSTLLKTLNGLIPAEVEGTLEGEVRIGEVPVSALNHKERCLRVGLVFQSPDDQLFTTKVEEEVLFGLRHLNLLPQEAEKRLKMALLEVGLEDFRHRSTLTLSGGEKQRLAIASILAMQPRLLALDEPLAQLDLDGIRQVLKVLLRLKRQGMTIILVEHRLPWVEPYANRAVIIHEGRVLFDGPPKEIDISLLKRLGLKPIRPPQFPDLEGLKAALVSVNLCPQKWVLKAEGISYESIIKNISLTLIPQEMVAIVGPNGAGKSTLLHLLAGLFSPHQGEIKREGRVGLVLQNPDLMLFTETVWEEIGFGLKQKGLPSLEIEQRVGEILSALNLKEFKERPPQALSRGQRLRVAVASVIALEPDILLLDEPTSGQDAGEVERLMQYLHTLKTQGKNIVFVTHDLDVAYKWADRVLFMEKGEITFCGGKGARH